MKYASTIVTVIAYAMISSRLFAGSNEEEFLQIREKRDKARDTASALINDLYQASLQKLLQRATADGDKTTAAKVQHELQLLGGASAAATLSATGPAQTKPRGELDVAKLRARLTETKWRLSEDKTFILHSDGTSTSNWTPQKGGWKVTGPSTLELSIWNMPGTDAVTVDEGVSLMTWVEKDEDQTHAKVAKKIASIAPPIAGEWVRAGDHFLFNDDGTWTRKKDEKGTWSWVDARSGSLVMRWDSNPKWVDSYILSADGRHLQGHNLDRTIFFTMERVK